MTNSILIRLRMLALMTGFVVLGTPALATTNDPGTAPAGDLWFPVGETIEYTIYWGRIPVAQSTASSSWEELDGRKLIAIRFQTKSNKVLSTLYPVDDFIESLIDPETFLPVRFTKKLSEGRYRCFEVTTFDHEKGTAVMENKRRGWSKEYEIDSDTRDLITFMYSMRTEEFQVGSKQDYRVMADEKLYDLEVKALKEEDVKLPRFGKVPTVMLEPEAAFQGLFVRKGKMVLWVSDDDRRLIARASIKVPVASVNLVLDKVTGPGEDDWVNPDPEKPRERRRRQ